MRMGNFDLSEQQVERFCLKWKIEELWLFGSALREDFRAESDLDFLVKFTNDAGET